MESEVNTLSELKVAGNVDKEYIPSNDAVGTRWIYAVKSDRRFKPRIVPQRFRDNLKLNASDVLSPACKADI